VEGTRARSARDRIDRISGVPLELAIERGLPVVPVRLIGGLPVEPLAQKLDFPVGMAAQDIVIGAPIEPAELARLSYRARIERVTQAIEALAPADETPHEGDVAFASAVARRMEHAGIDLPHAVLVETLREANSPCALTTGVLDAAERGAIALDDSDPEQRWLAGFARRLLGRA
jgi:hypothetical protein